MRACGGGGGGWPAWWIFAVFVRASQTLVLDVEPSTAVAEVKAQIAAREGVPVDEQRLVLAGLQLEDERTLEEYGVMPEATVTLVMRLLGGGGRKRKKKVYTKPKKIKHKHKTVKLAVLKFYKVDDKTGKIQRLRKECHQPTCGAGCFMAKHFNRYTCGKCTATYMHSGGKE